MEGQGRQNKRPDCLSAVANEQAGNYGRGRMSEKIDAHKEKRTFVFIVIPKSSLCSTRRCARWQSFGVPSEKWGETPLAAVILQRPGEITEAELCRWINERVDGKHQRVQAVCSWKIFRAAPRARR